HAQLAVERGRPHADVLAAQALELTRRQAELRRDGGDRDGAREVLLHEQQRPPYTRLGHGFGQRRVGLGIAARAWAGGQQRLARFLRDRTPGVLLDQGGCQRRSSGTAGGGDAWAVGQA